MQLLYYKGAIPNFGDELNPYIFNKLFDPDELAEKFSNHYIMGVGSILHEFYFNQLTEKNTAVIFGAGTRTASKYQSASKLDPFFVRGPISNNVYDCEYISDAAYLLNFVKEFNVSRNTIKTKEIALMPYYQHTSQVRWQHIAEATGIHIIMPYWPLHKIFKELRESKVLISGAMHGCIVADIMRIPWMRLRFPIHETPNETQNLKWMDWLFSIGITKNTQIELETLNDETLAENIPLENELIQKINEFKKSPKLTLSSDTTLLNIQNKLAEKIHCFSHMYQIEINSHECTL